MIYGLHKLHSPSTFVPVLPRNADAASLLIISCFSCHVHLCLKKKQRRRRGGVCSTTHSTSTCDSVALAPPPIHSIQLIKHRTVNCIQIGGSAHKPQTIYNPPGGMCLFVCFLTSYLLFYSLRYFATCMITAHS